MNPVINFLGYLLVAWGLFLTHTEARHVGWRPKVWYTFNVAILVLVGIALILNAGN